MAIKTLINAGSILVAGVLLIGVLMATNWYLKAPENEREHGSVNGADVIAAAEPTPSDPSSTVESLSPVALNQSSPLFSGASEQSSDLVVSSGNDIDTSDETATDSLASSENLLSKYIDFTTLGETPLTDEELLRLSQALDDDPLLREQLLAEFRANMDPDRVRVLVWLIGQFEDDSATQIGGELIFSGDPVSQQAGLKLLGALQPRVDAAREMVASLIMIEPNSEVLVSALDAMARPGVLPEASQEQLTQRFVELSSHQDERMRSHSMALLGRWAPDADVTATLVTGVQDDSADVRESAVFALASMNVRTASARDALLAVIQNQDEVAETRQGAINALRQYSLDSDQQALVDSIHVELQRPR